MTIIVLDGQGGGIGRAIISALLPLLPQGAQLLCVGTNAMATAAMLKAGAQRGATGENAVRWAAQNADILIAPIALVLKDSMMGEITGNMAAAVGSSRVRLWPFCITFGLTLHSYCLIIKGLKPLRLPKRFAKIKPFHTQLNVTQFPNTLKTRNEGG